MEMVAFRDMPYQRPDMDEVRKAYEGAIDALLNAQSYGEARSAYFEHQEKEKRFGTMLSLCSVRNTIDTTDSFYDGEMKWLRAQSAGLIPLRKQFQSALASSPFRADFEKEFGAQLTRLIDAALKDLGITE